MLYKKLLCWAIVATMLQSVSLAAPPAVNPNIVPQGGMVNTHDMNMLKELKRQQDAKKDFKNYQERKKEEAKEKEQL